MKIAIISTSINPEPEAYEPWSKIGDLYVAGDQNSPNELEAYVTKLGGHYFSPADQGKWHSSEAIGWRSIQRRNIALLEALDIGGYDYYVSVDDDNFPGKPSAFVEAVETQFARLPAIFAKAMGGSMWYNPGDLGIPGYRQRGLPAQFFSYRDALYGSTSKLENVKPGVVQCQILGDPDCDAVQRIVHPVSVQTYKHDVFVERGVYAPFNSQATIWPARFAPLLAVIPGAERYDDIYASIIATRILHHLEHVVVFGGPYVRQYRNEHDLGKDLAAEVVGMNEVQKFAEFVDQIELDEHATDAITHWAEVLYQLDSYGLLPHQATNFWRDFLLDVATTNWEA